MDDIDKAQQHIEKELENAIRAARGVMPADTRSAEVCEECGEPIPEARRDAISGCRLCAWCASEVESLRRRGLL
jgi:phage/conjugal plasmid C-4 type zinc finger TraR family protein